MGSHGRGVKRSASQARPVCPPESPTQGLQDDLQSLGLKIKQHEDNIRSLKARKNILDDSILDKEVVLGKYHSFGTPIPEDNCFSNGGEEETAEQILKHNKSAAGILCQLKTHHGTHAPILDLAKDVIGVVATLAKVDNENLSRLLSEYLGVETMLSIVCKTREGIKALEAYDKEGCIDKSAGLHGLGSSVGRVLDGRFLVICLEDIRPYVGDFVADDPQRRLDLIKPRLPNGEFPPGFLGFAVNMVNMDMIHVFCLTASGYGLRETLFYHLFSRTQVYSTRMDMLRALPFISGGAISLDGGMIRGPGIYSLGNRLEHDYRKNQVEYAFRSAVGETVFSRLDITQDLLLLHLSLLSNVREDVDVRFPLPSAAGASGLPANYQEMENQMKDLKWKREKLLEDLRREQQKMDRAKLNFERKKQEFVVFLARSSSYLTQMDSATVLERPSRSRNNCFANIQANSLVGTLTALPATELSGSRPRSKRSRLHGTSLVALNKGAGPAEAEGGRGGPRRQCAHCASEKTPQWRAGPLGPKTLCNTCGVQYRSGQLVPKYRPAASPSFLVTQHSNSHRKAVLSGNRPRNKRSRLPGTSRTVPSRIHLPASEGAGPAEAKKGRGGARQRCTHCASEKTPQWRAGPLGPKTLCNACGVRYKSGQLAPEYRPVASPTFSLTQHSNSHGKAALSSSRPKNKRSRLHWTSPVAPKEGARPAEAGGGGGGARWQCAHCASEKTPRWREGPLGPKTLCNACGLRYKSRRLVPEYRPAGSPTFVSTQHSNSHQKVMELHQQKEAQLQQKRHRGGEGQAYRHLRDLKVD